MRETMSQPRALPVCDIQLLLSIYLSYLSLSLPAPPSLSIAVICLCDPPVIISHTYIPAGCKKKERKKSTHSALYY
jgi:hypothetical protein